MSEGNDLTGFLITHHLIRRVVPELGSRLGHVGAGDAAAVERLTQWWHIFTEILEGHHAGEDRFVWPVALAADPGLIDIAQELESQHGRLDGHLEAIDEGLRTLAKGPADWDAELTALLARIDGFDAMMRDHLELEETRMVPVLERDVSEQTFKALSGQLARNHSMDSFRRDLPMVLEMADPNARAAMIERIPAAVRKDFVESWEPQYRQLVAALPGS
ncbi:hemerythrin domain-containing protein [Kutzneria kofuensis]|uniref:Hemerythrin-like domain-containing protein n=1 Tax=Kutzneria kofuensis TaxID=103725 RepID=A0A7W9KDL8_9PSEU|nr:hemerythrin domain-containing protein [Kutzneria kofuensis]MBB5890253.1 hemerythrin-like domain-containing protein [Kutzneria kofuensis]